MYFGDVFIQSVLEYTQVFTCIIKCGSKSSTVEAKSKVTSEITTLLLR